MPRGVRIGSVLAGFAVLAFMLVVGLDASAKPKQTSTMQIPKGATVQMQTQSMMRMNNSNGETGTFDCRCSGAKHNGSCILGRGSSTIICGTEGSTCEGTCKLFTTTGGISGGVMMMKKN